MNVETFVNIINSDFYTGVPDSLLKPLCNFLMNTYGIDPLHHIIAANEGNCCGLASGYYLATGKVPVVYMQNSGEGNIINPAASLLNERVYCIPVIFIIGWRGEPGVHDEPQHIYQGMVTRKLLDDMEIENSIITKATNTDELQQIMNHNRDVLSKGKQVAFVVEKGALSYDGKVVYKNDFIIKREEIIRHVVKVTGQDPIISTTGKASRELFEIREANEQGHRCDFLTVGSMGHASSIALGVALNHQNKKVWCIDGDGAALMHMGAMAVIGANAPKNMVHIIINNEAHETVGGMPTVAASIDLTGVAKACGYPETVCVDTYPDLDRALEQAVSSKELFFIEAKCAIGSRANLGRPTTSARKNGEEFRKYLQGNFAEC